jgi:hypothetical protein
MLQLCWDYELTQVLPYFSKKTLITIDASGKLECYTTHRVHNAVSPETYAVMEGIGVFYFLLLIST